MTDCGLENGSLQKSNDGIHFRRIQGTLLYSVDEAINMSWTYAQNVMNTNIWYVGFTSSDSIKGNIYYYLCIRYGLSHEM